MAFSIGDRVKETTTTTGTGSIALAGAVTGYRSLASVMSVGDTCWYYIAAGANWEVGIGTLSAATTLQRTTVLASSNGGALVSFPAGTKEVAQTLPALFGWKLNSAGIWTKETFVTVSGSFSYDAATNYATIEGCGGGGAGGGVPILNSTSAGAGTGGGSGGEFYDRVSRPNAGAWTANIVIGAAGAIASGAAGGAGGDTTYGDGTNAYTGGGGDGGGSTSGATGRGVRGSAGGSATGSKNNVNGTPSEPANVFGATVMTTGNGLGRGSNGGSGTYGNGGRGGTVGVTGGTAGQQAGSQSYGYGAGGGGGAAVFATTVTEGTAGRPGLVIVREYI